MMSRRILATIAGLAFVSGYIVAAVVLADALGRMNWAIEAVYWCIAGVIWVLPIRSLMLWSVR